MVDDNLKLFHVSIVSMKRMCNQMNSKPNLIIVGKYSDTNSILFLFLLRF